MKRKGLLILILSISLWFFTACEKEHVSDNIVTKDSLAQELDEKFGYNVTINNGYLSFCSTEDFYNVLDWIDKSQHEYYLWAEQLMNFEPARIIMDKAHSKIEHAQTMEEYEQILSEYSQRLAFCEDAGLTYPFFAHSLAGVLNQDGLVEIAGVLYKFTDNEQIIVLDGSKKTLNKYLQTKDSSMDSIIVLGGKDKSSSWGTLQSKGPLYGNKSRLYSKLELYSIYSPIWNGSQYVGWRVGFLLRQSAYQQRKNIFGGWYKNKTEFTLRDGAYSLFSPLEGLAYSANNLYKRTETRDFTYTFKKVEYNGDNNAYPVRPTIHNLSSRITSRGIGAIYIEHDYQD